MEVAQATRCRTFAAPARPRSGYVTGWRSEEPKQAGVQQGGHQSTQKAVCTMREDVLRAA